MSIREEIEAAAKKCLAGEALTKEEMPSYKDSFQFSIQQETSCKPFIIDCLQDAFLSFISSPRGGSCMLVLLFFVR